MTTTTDLQELTAEQVAEYHRNGFIIVEDIVSPEEREALIAHFMGVHSGEQKVDWFEPRDPESRPDLYWKRLFQTHQHDKLSMDTMRLPRAGRILHDLLGTEAVGIQSMFFFKAPGTPGQASHQDTNYIGSDPESLTACWIALDDADEDNGTMWVVPGSNGGPLLKRGKIVDTTEFEDWTDELVDVDYSNAVPVRAPAGSAVFFHGRLIHESRLNRTTDRFRRVYVCHYVAKGAEVARKDLQEQILFE